MNSRRLTLSTAIALPVVMSLDLGAAAAQDAFDWTGMYVGASLGSTQTNSAGTIAYGEGDSVEAGWTSPDGYFTGEIYNDVDSSSVTADGPDNDQTADLDMGSLVDWMTEASTLGDGTSGSVFGGAQWQFGNFVVGSEFRVGTGAGNTSYSYAWLDGTDDSDQGQCDVNNLTDCNISTNLPGTGLLWSGTDTIEGETLNRTDHVYIDGSVDQRNSIAFASNIGISLSAVARAGIAFDRVLFYGLAGPTVAQVSASTAASVQETGAIDVSSVNEAGSASLDGGHGYYWEGSTAEQRVSAEIGLGAEVALTDNVILRGEASYSNFGSISVTGYSEETDATYTVTQDLSRVSVQTGILFKF